MFIREMTVTVLRCLDSRNDGEMMAVLAYEDGSYTVEHEDYITRRRALMRLLVGETINNLIRLIIDGRIA